jgi:hypothetical protein
MSKINGLIESFQKEQKARRAKETVDRIGAIAKAEIEFSNRAMEYLGEILGELNPGSVTHRFIRPSSTNEVSFELPVSFQGRAGRVTQTKSDLYATGWGFDMYIDFGYMDGKDVYSALIIKLPAESKDLGYLFATITERLEWQKKQHEQQREQERIEAMNFHGFSEEGVANKLFVVLKEYPEDREQIEAAAASRRAQLAQKAQERLTLQLARELKASEEAQLESIRDYAWHTPFEVIKVRYGAKIDSEEGIVYTDHFYTIDLTPGNDGYWRAFQAGQLKGRIQPTNMISKERVVITTPAETPDDLRRWITLESKVVKDVSIGTFIPPIELFAFDYDELRVAVEKDQDAEIVDATQEDLS